MGEATDSRAILGLKIGYVRCLAFLLLGEQRHTVLCQIGITSNFC